MWYDESKQAKLLSEILFNFLCHYFSGAFCTFSVVEMFLDLFQQPFKFNQSLDL